MSFSNLLPLKGLEQGFLGLNLKIETIEALNRGLGNIEPRSSMLKRGDTLAPSDKVSPKTAKFRGKGNFSPKKPKRDMESNPFDIDKSKIYRVTSPVLSKQSSQNPINLFDISSPRKMSILESNFSEEMPQEKIKITPLDNDLVQKIDNLKKRFSQNSDMGEKADPEKKGIIRL
jgi:hypothetical protein